MPGMWAHSHYWASTPTATPAPYQYPAWQTSVCAMSVLFMLLAISERVS